MRISLFLFLAAACVFAAVHRNVEYGAAGEVHLLMDVSVPPGPGPFPAVVLVHGGAWFQGDKSAGFEPILPSLDQAGYAWFSINYRLAPKYLYPAAVEDVEQSIRFIRAHASEFHVDPTRIALMGESAGAHLAELAATRNQPGASVEAVVAFFAPSDLVNLARSRKEIPDSVRSSGWADLLDGALQALSPVTRVTKDMPPVLFVHGTADSLVPFEESTTMCGRMKEAGADCEVIPIKNGDHGLNSWESLPAKELRYKQQVIDWLNRELDWKAVALGV